jgi:hypothetical protein
MSWCVSCVMMCVICHEVCHVSWCVSCVMMCVMCHDVCHDLSSWKKLAGALYTQTESSSWRIRSLSCFKTDPPRSGPGSGKRSGFYTLLALLVWWFLSARVGTFWQCCGSASRWCWSGFDLSPWWGSGFWFLFDDADLVFYLMRIRIRLFTRIWIQILSSK